MPSLYADYGGHVLLMSNTFLIHVHQLMANLAKIQKMCDDHVL